MLLRQKVPKRNIETTLTARENLIRCQSHIAAMSRQCSCSSRFLKLETIDKIANQRLMALMVLNITTHNEIDYSLKSTSYMPCHVLKTYFSTLLKKRKILQVMVFLERFVLMMIERMSGRMTETMIVMMKMKIGQNQSCKVFFWIRRKITNLGNSQMFT